MQAIHSIEGRGIGMAARGEMVRTMVTTGVYATTGALAILVRIGTAGS